ncbi:hypothetical protein FPV67DRAFT_1420121 [Lyophyllum atratum]|nr:hypothetical protein FPV67DRAFT_1420121 [Lyophyllum atratum]
MPSFLSKVFGRKKDDKESPRSSGHLSSSELLDGKFESVSPSATTFPEVANGKGAGQGKEKDAGFSLFKSKSSPASPEATEKRVEIPHLSLNLPGPKDESASRALGVVFEADPEARILLSDAAIGGRRLNPLETLILVRACSQAITARGTSYSSLESLGIMHPHWHSASPEIQRRLISLFIQSLAQKTPITTLSPTSSAFVTAFESEISSTRSPHDVAAVLRWGLRHLQLDGNSFGKEDSWYKNFFGAEQSSSYPADGFSTILGPALPPSHLELLTVTLEIFSSLAAHAEGNGISGSKLAKFFGLWLLTVQRAHEDDDWATFYARWERTGRMLEHLFLSRIRDEASSSRMPTRLLELVKQYPYNKNPSPDTDLLPRPRFSTRRYDALFVRIETGLSATADQPAHHPLRLIADAFRAEPSADAGEHAALWEIVRKAFTDDSNHSPGASPGLSHIFADETLRFFSLIPIENAAQETTSPSFNLFIPSSHRRSFSLNGRDRTAATTTPATGNETSKHTKPATDPSVAPSSVIGTDWATFSTSGFFEDASAKAPLATTLIDTEKDMEVTVPKRLKTLVPSLSTGRKSLDAPRALVKVEQPKPKEAAKPISKFTHVSLTQLDEAFIDFWSDALLDPISSTWPTFIICKLKSTLTDVEVDGKRLEWLVIEQAFKRPAPLTPLSPENSSATASPDSAGRTRPSSPRSFKSEITFSSTMKRFSFFTSGRASTSSEKETRSKKTAGQSPRVGEMGEILAEEDEGKEKEKEKEKQAKSKKVDTGTVRVRIPSPKPRKSVEVPRKSVDVAKKSVDDGSKTNGHGVAGIAAGAAAVTAAVAVHASKPEEPATEAPATNGSTIENVTTPAPSEPLAAPEAPLPVEGTAPASSEIPKAEEAAVPAPAPAQPADEPTEPARLLTEADLLQSATNPHGPPSADLICIFPGRPQEGEAEEKNEAAGPETEAEAPALEPESAPEVVTEPQPTPIVEPTAVEPEAALEDSERTPTQAEPTPVPAASVEDVFKPTPAVLAVAEPAALEPVEPSSAVPDAEATEPAEVVVEAAAEAEPVEESEESVVAAVVESEVDAAPAIVEAEPTPVVAVEPEVAEVEVAPETAANDIVEPVPAAVVEVEAEPEAAPVAPIEEPAPVPAAAIVEAELTTAVPEPEAEPDVPVEAETAAPAPIVPAETESSFPEVHIEEPTPADEIAEPTETPAASAAESEAVEPEAEAEVPDVVEEESAIETEVSPEPVPSTEVEEAAQPDAVAAVPEVALAASEETIEAQPIVAEESAAVEEPAVEEPAIEEAAAVSEPESEVIATPVHSEPIAAEPEAVGPEAEAEVPVVVEEEAAPETEASPEPVPAAEVEEVAQPDAVAAEPEPAPAASEEFVEAEPVVAEESAAVDEPVVEAPAIEDAAAVPEPESEVIAAPVHSEPINASEDATADEDVTLSPVPIVDVEPVVPVVEEPAPALEEETAPVELQEEPTVEDAELVVEEEVTPAETEEEPATVESVVLAGSTPGPQAVLDSVVEPEAEPTHPDESVSAAAEPSSVVEESEPVESAPIETEESQ